MTLVINFSGGKDSCAMLDYLCKKYPHLQKYVVFADTGWEHTDAEQWCRSIVARYGLELHVVRNNRKDFFGMVRNRGMFPGMQTRQCTSDLKRDPIMQWIRKNVTDPVVINCMGIRAEESPNRARMPRLKRNKRECNSRRTVWNWNPILDWTETRVRQHLADNDIPLHPVYQYLNRFSCQVCIYMSQHDLRQTAKFNRPALERIAEVEQEIGFTMFQGMSMVEFLQQH